MGGFDAYGWVEAKGGYKGELAMFGLDSDKKEDWDLKSEAYHGMGSKRGEETIENKMIRLATPIDFPYVETKICN